MLFWRNRSWRTNVFTKIKRINAVFFRKKYIKIYFQMITGNGIVTQKKFLFKKQSCLEQNNIVLIKDDNIVSEETDLVETFSKRYVYNSSRIKFHNVALLNTVIGK